MNNNSKTTSGVSTTTVVQIVFLILKLAKLIDWSWFWVLSPTIFSTGLVVTYLTVVGLISAVKVIKKNNKKKKMAKNDEFEREMILARKFKEHKEQELDIEKTSNFNEVEKTMTSEKVNQEVKPEYIWDEEADELISGPSLKMTKKNNNI